jgi:hypothetical protein
MKPIEALAAPLIALVVYALLHVAGIGMVVDGWAAWEGAASLATGHGYTYLSGEPVRAWAPLYSLYLAAWIFFTGPVGWSLIAANAVLISAQAFCWYQLTRMTCADSGLKLEPPTSIALSVFLALYLNSIQWQVFGHNLVYVLLPLFLAAIWKCVAPNKPPSTWGPLALAIGLGAALMATHNSSVAFVGAAALMIAFRQSSLRTGAFQALLLVAIPSAVWKLVRDALGQAGSHPIGLGNGRYTFLQYVEQLIQGSGELLAPDRYFAPFVVVIFFATVTGLLLGQKKASALRFGTGFVAASLAILLVMFNLTWVVNELNGRFLLYIPLLMLLPLFVLARDIAPKSAMAVAVLVAIPQVYWVTNWGTRQIRETLAQQGFPDSFVMPNVYLSRSYLAGPPVRTEHGILISPFAFNDPAGKRTSDQEPEH